MAVKYSYFAKLMKKNEGQGLQAETQSLHTLAVCQLYLPALPVQTYKLTILKNIRVSRSKPQYSCIFAIQSWS